MRLTPSALPPALLALLALPATFADVVTITAANPIPTDPPQYTSDSSFQAAILNSTNFYRTEHNASALTWNTSLATYAANWAKPCVFEHSVRRRPAREKRGG
jgi:uncharacterized protein YkwD